MKHQKMIAALIFSMTATALMPSEAWSFTIMTDLMTYQGRLKENGVPVNGDRDVEISICTNVTGPTCFPTGVQTITATKGIFRTTFTLPGNINFVSSAAFFIEVAVGPQGGGLTTLIPREQLTKVPYAVLADSIAASGIVSGIIGSGVILPAAQLGTGVIASGVTLVATQVGSGILGTGVILPADQLGTGVLGAGVQLSAGQISTGILGSGILIPVGGGNGLGRPVLTHFIDSTNVGNGASPTEQQLHIYNLPANSLGPNRGVRVKAWGTTAANPNLKTIRFRFGPSTVVMSHSAPMNNQAWYFEATILFTGPNTQVVIIEKNIGGVSTVNVFNLAETDSNILKIETTGQPAIAIPNEIRGRGMTVEFLQ